MTVTPDGETERDSVQRMSRRLAENEALMVQVVKRHASRSLLAMETVEDLVQESCFRVLRNADSYEVQTGVSFEAWLQRVVINVLHGRSQHFRALKRDGAKVLRMAFSREDDDGLAWLRDITASRTGPWTFAERRERLHLAARALDTLLERDRVLIDGLCNDRSLAEESSRLGLSQESTSKARQRALERLRSAFKVVVMGIETDR